MDDLNFNVDDIINDVNAKIKSAEKNEALKQSLSVTLRTVPKPVNRQIILTRNHRKLQKRSMTSLNLS